MSKHGFTLLELMIVIAILGIALVVMAPKLEVSKDDFKLRSTAQNCISDIRYAQQLSIDTKEKHKITLKDTGYEIINIETDEKMKTINFNNGVSIEKLENESGYEIANIVESPYSLVFDSEGKPCEEDETTAFTESVKVFLKASSLYAYLKITPSTGEVSIVWN